MDPGEIARRFPERAAAVQRYRRGYGAIYMDNVLQASEGCDFAALRRLDDDDDDSGLPLGLLKGWVLGN